MCDNPEDLYDHFVEPFNNDLDDIDCIDEEKTCHDE